MKILITGSNGFLGKELYNTLDKTHKCITYDLSNGEDINNFKQLNDKIKSNNIDMIIHLAAVANLNFFADDTSKGYKINVEGTRNIIKTCELNNCILLFASTCCCYGNNTDTKYIDENSKLYTNEPYALSKIQSEQDISKSDIKSVIMRLATFYGENARKELATSIFINNIHHKQCINIHGYGNQTRTFTYVHDIISGICKIIDNIDKAIQYKIINITSEEVISINQCVGILENIINNKAIVNYENDRQFQIKSENFLSKRLQSLGWKYISFNEGMKLTYKWFKKNNYKFN